MGSRCANSTPAFNKSNLKRNTSLATAFVPGVMIPPGKMALILNPSFPCSFAKALVRAITPALVML
jgi:hypothetical protein